MKNIMCCLLCVMMLFDLVLASGSDIEWQGGDLLRVRHEGQQKEWHDENGNYNSIVSNMYMTSVAKGSKVYKVGSTSKWGSGVVKDTNFTVTSDGKKFKNFTKTTLKSESGDSGGLVYMYYNGGYKPAGLIHGSAVDGSYSVYCKAKVVVDEMQVYPY